MAKLDECMALADSLCAMANARVDAAKDWWIGYDNYKVVVRHRNGQQTVVQGPHKNEASVKRFARQYGYEIISIQNLGPAKGPNG